MSPEDRALADLAASVADGEAVDWQSAQHALPPSERRFIRHLRLVESIAQVYRTLPEVETAGIRVDTGDELRRWGPLLILERIGEGSTGEVYRAWDPQLQRDVALKLLYRDRHDAHQRVLEEARRLARIRHEHVVHVYGAEEHDGRVGMWMELVRGESLEERVRTRGPIGASEAARIGAQLCAALGAVHSAGLLHRDVKAQNVTLEGSGRTVLMDFGTGEPLRRSRGTNRMVGTPLYLAPELFKGQSATVRSDIYSLGVLLFYLVAGEYPVRAASMQDLGRAHSAGLKRRLSELQPDAPATFIRVVDRALENDPAHRFESVSELERALVGSVQPHASTKSARATVLSRTWGFVAAAVFLLVATTVLVLLARGRPSPVVTVRRIAVMPLTDLSPAGSPPYLADALTDRLVASLARVSDFQVTSPSSARRFKNPEATVSEIAQGLNVDGIIQGSISVRAGEGEAHRVRLDTRLIAAGTGLELWSGAFVGTLGELTTMQAEVVKSIAERLGTSLASSGRTPLAASRPQTTAKAEAAYLAGRYHLSQYGVDSVSLAADAFRRATELDPNHALARADLARCYLFLATGSAMSSAKGRALAAAEVNRALAIDDGLAEAHAVRADLVFYYDWDWAEAEREYRRAIELDPSATFQRIQFAKFLAAARRVGEALAEIEAARQLDPLSAETAHAQGVILSYARRFADAERVLQYARQLDPQYVLAVTALGRAYEAQGRYAEALDAATRALQMAQGPTIPLRIQHLRLRALAGQPAEAEAAYRDLQREVASRGVTISPEQLAYLELALGNRERALELLEQAVNERQALVLWLAVDSRVDPLRSDPRFEQILRALAIP